MYSLIALAVVVTFFHDAGIYASARRTLVEGTRAAASNAAQMRTERNTAAARALEVGAAHGVTVFAYSQEDDLAEVWAQTDVEGTWLLALITRYIENRPADRPYTIQHVERARIQ